METTERTLGELVTERPSRAEIFEKLGLDYCCGGARSLGDACFERGLDPAHVRILVEDAEVRSEGGDRRDVAQMPLSELVDHIVATHHSYLHRVMPRVSGYFEKVIPAHGHRHPELAEVRGIFEYLADELRRHMWKEEEILFPLIKSLEAGADAGAFHCGSILGPIEVMEAEHDSAGFALAELRRLTSGYYVPEDACHTYGSLLNDLRKLEEDLHLHIHKENNVLFPRALAFRPEPV